MNDLFINQEDGRSRDVLVTRQRGKVDLGKEDERGETRVLNCGEL